MAARRKVVYVATHTTLVGLKVTATELALIDELVRNGYYHTRSAAIRAALMMLFDSHKVKLDARVKVRLERIAHPLRRARGYKHQHE